MEEPFNPTYYSTVDELQHCEWTLQRRVRFELLRRSIRTLWPQGHPTRLVQVAGTAGKGSTCRFLEAGFSLFGKSGSLTSPELFDYRERFSVAGRPVSREDLTAAWETRIRPHGLELALQNEQHVLFDHEANVLIALALFEQHAVEWAAVETAVGGRYDQTSALDVTATVLTNVGSDHAEELGHVPWQRALDKAGIARRGVPFITGEKDAGLLRLIAGVCRDVGAPFHALGAAHQEALERRLAAAAGTAGGDLAEGALLAAAHQRWNAALALEALKTLFPDVDPRQAVAKFLEVQLPGRSWQVDPSLFADVAHNPEKVAALARDLERRFAGKDKIFVVGVANGQSAAVLLAPLLKLARVLIITQALLNGEDPHAVKKELEPLAGEVVMLVVPDPAEAIEVAKAMRRERDVIVVTGDMDVLDQALNPDPYLRYMNARAGWRAGT
jgi:dihydrofolate synthase/folylpolyglutamate synthase